MVDRFNILFGRDKGCLLSEIPDGYSTRLRRRLEKVRELLDTLAWREELPAALQALREEAAEGRKAERLLHIGELAEAVE